MSVFGKRGNQIGGRDVFRVHIDADLAVRQGQGLLEGGDLRAGKPGAEPRAGIQRANLVEGYFADGPRAVRGAVHRAIVHQHQVAVGGGAHVQLEEVGSGIDGGLKSGKRVFGMRAMLAAMGDDHEAIGAVFAHICERQMAPWCGEGRERREVRRHGFRPQVRCDALPQLEYRPARIVAGVAQRGGQTILMEIGGDELDLPGFGWDGCGVFALERLGVGMIHLEHGGAYEGVHSPGARVEAGAEDDELCDGCSRGDRGSRTTVRNWLSKPIPRSQNGYGDFLGLAGRAASARRSLALQLSGSRSAASGSEKRGTCGTRMPKARL